MKQSVFLSFFLFIFFTEVFAQSPGLINYQSVIRDANGGLIVDQTIGIRFTIRKSTENGEAVFVEEQTEATNEFGMVNTQIGKINDTLANVRWGMSPMYLQVEVDPNGGTSYEQFDGDNPQLVSVPYALHARTVEFGGSNDNDADSTNEYNTSVILSNTNLEVTDGGGTITADLSSLQDGTGTDDQNLDSLTLNGTILTAYIEDGDSATVDLGVLNTGTDDQNIDSLSLNGTLLTVHIENGNSASEDLSILQDGTGTDDQNITGSGLTGTNLTIGIENGASQIVDLSSLQDGTGTDDQNITGSGLTGTNLTIGIENGASQIVDLSSLQDGVGTDDQVLTFSNDTLSIENGNNIYLGAYATADTLSFIQDNDGNTKIQTEESLDEDIIRFDLDGTEHFTMVGPRLNVLNSGNSVMIGNNAGQNDDLSNNENIFIGANAGLSITTGQRNVAIGRNAYTNVITGNENIAIGWQALNAATLNANVAIGHRALESNTGQNNVAIGYQALQLKTTGLSNVAIGYGALQSIAASTQNVAVGMEAGQSKSGGNNNVFLGYRAGQNNGSGSGNVFLGDRVGQNEAGSNLLYVHNSNTTTPLIYGEFNNNWLKVNGHLTPTLGLADSDNNTKIQVEESTNENRIRFDINGVEAMMIDDNRNIGIGTSSPSTFVDIRNTSGDAIVKIDAPSSTDEARLEFSKFSGIGQAAIGYFPGNAWLRLRTITNHGILFEPNGIEQARITPDGKFGININPSTNSLEVGGNASKSTAGDWLANSDERLKKNITCLDSEHMLNNLLALKGITYEWNDDKTGSKRPEGIHYGFTAQNIQQVFPTLVTEDGNGYLQTPYGTYDAMTVEAIRALNNKIEILQKENETMKKELSKMEELQAEVELIKNQIGHSEETSSR